MAENTHWRFKVKQDFWRAVWFLSTDRFGAPWHAGRSQQRPRVGTASQVRFLRLANQSDGHYPGMILAVGLKSDQAILSSRESRFTQARPGWRWNSGVAHSGNARTGGCGTRADLQVPTDRPRRSWVTGRRTAGDSRRSRERGICRLEHYASLQAVDSSAPHRHFSGCRHYRRGQYGGVLRWTAIGPQYGLARVPRWLSPRSGRRSSGARGAVGSGRRGSGRPG